MIFRPQPSIRIPSGKKELALLLAGGVIMGGTYLWKILREAKNMKKRQDYPDSMPVTDEPSPFGTMRGSKEIALKSVSLDGMVEGLLFSSTIRQEYRNETDEALEIIYTFPVGYNTALLGMDATIGDRQLHGEVVQKEEAEEKYEDALDKGNAAIMLQQSSSGLYTANLGNIKPGETVSVAIHCARLLNYEQGRIRIVIPTVIGERYGDEHCPGGLSAHESARPDANASYAFSLELVLKGDLGKGIVECPSHQVRIDKTCDGISVKLNSQAYLDRDFVLLVKGLQGESHALCVPDEDKWLACASFCQHMDEVEDDPLALKLLVDCSGSMRGMSMEQARKGLREILRLLSPGDHVAYSCFGSEVRHFANSMLPCTLENMRKLGAAIEATDADMGGTEMEQALLASIRDIKTRPIQPAALLLITDGKIWEAKRLLESAKASGHRIFVIGVGAAPAEGVLMDLALQTGGACEFVTPNENMAEAIVRMFHRMRGKIVRDIRIDWAEKPLWQSQVPKYIYDGETVHAFALLDKRPAHGPTLTWLAGNRKYTVRMDRIEDARNCDLARLGRRCQMRESLTEKEKVAIALKYQLVSELTSLVLVHERAKDEQLKGLPRIQQVPQMQAYGHGNYAMSNCFMDIWPSNFVPPHNFNSALLDLGASSFEKMGKGFVGRQDEPLLNEFAEALLLFWQGRLFSLSSLNEFITDFERTRPLRIGIRFLENVAKKCGVQKDAVYAVLLERLLQEKGDVDRHSLRLLKPHWPAGEKTQEICANLEYGIRIRPLSGPIICR